MLDLLIKGATVVDGTGEPAYVADVGIKDGRIVAIGAVTAPSAKTLAADGLHLTPGFIDIHTHYDGQASWDPSFSPSIYHGVTTLVMGNCGVGFAPVVPGQEDRLLNLMEGVEEIPGAALAEGIRWGWRSFAEFCQTLDAMPHSLDFMTLVPHDCLRLYVMGERAARGEPATPQDLTQMQGLLREALAQGAAGFSTGRTDNHRTADGQATPAFKASRDELIALASSLRDLPYRVLHAVSDFASGRGEAAQEQARFDAEYSLLEDMARSAARPLAITWMERINSPAQWQWLAQAAMQSAAQGVDVRLQAAARGIGVMNGLDTSFNVLMAFPGYRAIAHLPPAERAARMRQPATRAQILAESPMRLSVEDSSVPPLVDMIIARLDQTAAAMFALRVDAGGVNYEPEPSTSFAAQAAARGVGVKALMYDYLAEGDGSNLIYFPIFNYLRGSLDTVYQMLQHPRVLASLGDAGAHVGTVCDASMPTTLLAHWVLHRSRGPRLPLEHAVHLLTQRNAQHLGLQDRGTVAVGRRADLNLLDLAALSLPMPELVRDLPAGGRRFIQKSTGYVATLVAGEAVVENGQITSARPGRWVRAQT